MENIKISEDCIRADVYGTEEYEVEIAFDDDVITNM